MPRTAEDGFSRGGRLVWRTVPPLARLLFGVAFDFRREGHERIPPGPVVFAANHFSHLDPVILGATVDRPVRYLAVDELYGKTAFFDRLTVWLGAIPMSRTRAPLGALRVALDELASGGSVGLFPEGVRVWTWGEVGPKRGAAWLARRSGTPLVPVAIFGTDDAMGRGQFRIDRRPLSSFVCEPIHPADHEDAEDPLASMVATWEERIDAGLARLRSR
ncbi:MAG: lysophospholipid acyltransferase family protein [Acidimicrobiia bacterium]|nr:lysophospholipid acyltransferase family protein [Acidimicrobiia bacterium]